MSQHKLLCVSANLCLDKAAKVFDTLYFGSQEVRCPYCERFQDCSKIFYSTSHTRTSNDVLTGWCSKWLIGQHNFLTVSPSEQLILVSVSVSASVRISALCLVSVSVSVSVSVDSTDNYITFTSKYMKVSTSE